MKPFLVQVSPSQSRADIMNDLIIVLVAALCAGLMFILAKSSASPNLRSAIRTTMVLGVGWGLAAVYGSNSLTLTMTRKCLLLGLSSAVVALAWILVFSLRGQPQSEGPALMDRLNVFFAALFAIVLFYGRSDSDAWLKGLLLVAGAFILARGQVLRL